MDERCRLRTKTAGGGFTLLEVLIAMVILAVGLMAIAQMQITGLRFNAQGREMTEATTLGMGQLENLKALPSDHAELADTTADNNADLTSTTTVDHIDPGNPINGRFNRIWNVADGTDTKTVMVIVSWRSGPNQIQKRVRFSTFVAR
jgi:prepilin-type N-terminal cleavage/methylation domain-containing protein